MRTFTERLVRCAKFGDLTPSDLARWFDRPRATVNTWLNGRTPSGPSGRVAEHDLDLLEVMVRNKIGFPVPATLSWRDRINHVRGQRNVAERHARVPDLRPAG
jgi:hypothetical protein